MACHTFLRPWVRIPRSHVRSRGQWYVLDLWRWDEKWMIGGSLEASRPPSLHTWRRYNLVKFPVSNQRWKVPWKWHLMLSSGLHTHMNTCVPHTYTQYISQTLSASLRSKMSDTSTEYQVTKQSLLPPYDFNSSQLSLLVTMPLCHTFPYWERRAVIYMPLCSTSSLWAQCCCRPVLSTEKFPIWMQSNAFLLKLSFSIFLKY